MSGGHGPRLPLLAWHLSGPNLLLQLCCLPVLSPWGSSSRAHPQGWSRSLREGQPGVRASREGEGRGEFKVQALEPACRGWSSRSITEELSDLEQVTEPHQGGTFPTS